MSKLIVLRDGQRRELVFEGSPLLEDVLKEGGFVMQRPCGGRGVCGKCAVKASSGAISEPNSAEIHAGSRLSCQMRLLGDAQVELPDAHAFTQIELSGSEGLKIGNPMAGAVGAAVDVGTTTLALQLYDLRSGRRLAGAGMGNPQTAIAADVMGRIGAALNGEQERLRAQITGAIEELLLSACAEAGVSESMVESMVITGNTTMLYLLTGRNPEALSHAPFEADCLFDETVELLGRRVYLPPCMNAFVGADISCAVLAAGQCASEGTSLLCDIGTNGEIALWRAGTLYVTSTAAGPAFEGAGISCGCGSVSGAIDRVDETDEGLSAHTIGDCAAVGVCGSGLIDAVAVFLNLGIVDETGATEANELPLRDGVCLLPRDIRAVQLAKAAIAAGIETLLETAGVDVSEIENLYVAGGFGSHLRPESAARIGLIPEALQARLRALGNAAIAGAAQLLLNQDAQKELRGIVTRSRHVNLGGNPVFNEHYMDQMFFPEED